MTSKSPVENFVVLVYEALRTRSSAISVESIYDMALRAVAMKGCDLCSDTHDHRRLCEAARLLCKE